MKVTREYRFALGSDGDPCSAAWRIWTQGNEAYLAVRNFVSVAKLSLHSNGNWQFRAGPQVSRYRRPAPYRAGCVRGPGILIPHNDLGERLPYYDPKVGADINWLDQPLPGSVAQLSLHFLEDGIERDTWLSSLGQEVSLLATLKLRSGAKLCLVRSDRESNASELRDILMRRRLLDVGVPGFGARGKLYGLSLISVQRGLHGEPLLTETQVPPPRGTDVDSSAVSAT